MFGFVIFIDKYPVEIEKLNEGTFPLPMWNVHNRDNAVQAGDELVFCNGLRGLTAIILQLKYEEEVVLALRRPDRAGAHRAINSSSPICPSSYCGTSTDDSN